MATAQPVIPSTLLGQLFNEMTISRRAMDVLSNLVDEEPLRGRSIEKKMEVIDHVTVTQKKTTTLN